jgi:hypothetical protein
VDREVRELEKDQGDLISSWAYRLVCEFRYEGKTYRVTPDFSHLASFCSKGKVERYLDERIDLYGNCLLWVDPKNPLHTIFENKKWWL